MKLILFLLLGVYVVGAWKFWKGFRYTNFSDGRIILGLLWPALLLNGAYRKNFTKALKGS